MALTPTTLQTIVTAIRQRTNMENNQFVTDSELYGYINNSLSMLDSILKTKFDDYCNSNTVLTANSNGQVSLPLDFFKLRGVDVQVSASDPDGYVEMPRFPFQKRIRKPYLMNNPAGCGPSSLSYRLEGQFIQIEPISLSTQWSYRVWYTPNYILLVNPTDTLQTYMDSQAWYEYAIVDCAIKVLTKQDLDASTFMAQKAELSDHIIKCAAPNRDIGEPAAVTDTRGAGGGFGYGWDW